MRCNENNIKLSIIIPVYNKENYLRFTIESLENQNYEEFEVILIDDGSNETCCSLCDQLSREYSWIKVIHQVNMGVSFARNTGLSLARGKYILFMDADDLIANESISRIISLMDSTETDVCIFNYATDLLEQYQVQHEDWRTSVIVQNIESFQEMFVSMWNNNIINNIGTKVYKRAILSNLSFIPYNICEDICFCIDALIGSVRIMYLNKNIYIYRQNVSDSLMSSYKANYLDAACILLTKLNNLREKFNDTSSFDRAYKIYTSTMCKKILVNETYRGLRSFNKLCSLVASKKEFIPVIMNNGEGRTKDIIFYKLLAKKLYFIIYYYFKITYNNHECNNQLSIYLESESK